MKLGKGGGKKTAPVVDVKADPPRVPWTSRICSSVGLPWILIGIATYTGLTLFAGKFVHNKDGLEVLRREVPILVYDRSSSVFLTALTIDLLNIVFERQTIKIDCVLLPAFIKGMASTTNVLVRFFTPVVALTVAGRPVVLQRYICWMHTTPTMLMLLKMISSTITPRETLTAIMFDEIMVVTGALGLITTGWQRVLWSIVTHVAMLPVVPYMHKAFTEAMEQVRTRPLRLTMLCIYVLNLALWCTFAVTWDLALLGWISITTEEVLYVACDFSAKVLFSSTLMLSSFKEFEARRESAMRVIEGSSKAKLISELQALLEQKERFMSSVSHELRTPLNGIIGISEGMLSGCCGVLPEGVRRQIYIIRTSGARLLALINDVMDAAALRQNKLVLKQEQVVLRHVVDDVLDLTRSLVDTEVVLANMVPPRMLVMGDTGRIVQILNNLLGNAAKFTRRGLIRVTARPVDSGRKVAVTVSDTGIGIPRNKLATIFLPFEQVDMSISRKYGGFGLGLNIVQELVKAHGGTINVSSIEGKGSSFTFTLPLARAMGRESLEEAKAAALRASRAGSQAPAAAPADGAAAGGSSRTGGSGGPACAASATASGSTPRQGGGAVGDGGGDDSSTVLSSSDASRRPWGPGPGGGGTATADSELEQYGELMYNAAELSALASSRPYAQSVRESLPASCEDGSVVQSPVEAAAAVQAVSKRRSPSAAADGGAAAAVSRGGAAKAGSQQEGGGGGGSAASQGKEAAVGSGPVRISDKLVHGPRPFHFTMYKRFLLLSVDDDPVNQSVVKSLLGSTGYELVAVSSGAEALRYVSSAPALPDLVLLDCMMPEMDGYEVLQRLRAMTPHVHLPIIMVSAQTEEDHVVCGLDLGADDYVTKPFKRNELIARIRAQLAYGEWEQDEGALETISSIVGTDLPHPNSYGQPAASLSRGGGGGGGGGGLGILDSGNGLSDPAAASGGGSGTLGGVPAAMGGARRTSSPGASGGDQRLIVCIDDDDVNQVVLQGMLTSQHYRYMRASTGAQGLSYVCGTQSGGIPPDLVLLDCSLPDMTGFDVCRCIRQMYNKQQVPIIMLSARHNESAVVEGLKCGANTYVTKPFRRNELLARIRLHLRSRDPMPAGHPSYTESMTADESDSRAAAAALEDSGLGLSTPKPPRIQNAIGGAIGAAGSGGGSGGDGLEHPSVVAAAPAWGVDGGGGVRVWPDAAVLVVAVADYAGLCRMLLPSEMAELSSRMLAAFNRAVEAHGVVKVEAGSGVMSAAVMPSAAAAHRPLPSPPADGGSGSCGSSDAAAAAAAAAAGLRLAALHRVGRALLEAAATIPVPGTATCLQLQQALALGPIMGHNIAASAMTSAGGGAATILYFGPVLAELLDLARRAPPMTIVTHDAEAQALRASGATADIRGPLFLDVEDGGGGATTAAAAGRRLWLVEAHPFAYQYLPPQLLYASSALQSSFLQRSGTEEYDKASSSTSVAAAYLGGSSAAAAVTTAAAILQQQQQQAPVPPGLLPPHLQPSQPGLLLQHDQQLQQPQQLQQLQQQPHTHPLQQDVQLHHQRHGSLTGGIGGGAGGVGLSCASSPVVPSAHDHSPTPAPPTQQQQLGSTVSPFAPAVPYPSPQQLLSTAGPNPVASCAGAGAPPASAAYHLDATSPGTSGLSSAVPPAAAVGASGPSGGQVSSVSTSMGYNTSIGLYGNGLGMSRAGSRAYSYTNFVMELEAGQGGQGRGGVQHLPSGVSATHHSSGNGARVSSGNGTAAGAPPPGGALAAVSAMYGSSSIHGGSGTAVSGSSALNSSSGGPCITFSLQAAAAAVAAATTAGGGNGSHHLLRSAVDPGLIMQVGASTSSTVGAGGAGASGGSGYASTLGTATALSNTPSFLYGSASGLSTAQRVSLNNASAVAAAAGSGVSGSTGTTGVVAGVGGGGHGLVFDTDVTAAEPQIRALRNELAVMRQQLEALQSTSGRDSSAVLSSALLAQGAASVSYQSHQSQFQGPQPLAPLPLGLPPGPPPLPPASEDPRVVGGGNRVGPPPLRGAAQQRPNEAAGGLGGFVTRNGAAEGPAVAVPASVAGAPPLGLVAAHLPPHVHLSPPSAASGASAADAASSTGGAPGRAPGATAAAGDGTAPADWPAKKVSKLKSLFGRAGKATSK